MFSLIFPCLALIQGTILWEQAEGLNRLYTPEIVKTAPPSLAPNSEKALGTASVWFSASFDQIPTGAALSIDAVSWESLRDLCVGAIYLTPAQENSAAWSAFVAQAEQCRVALIGDLVGNAVEPNADFGKALQGIETYRSLYQLIEIDSGDWKLLPQVAKGASWANIPWLNLEPLRKQGYIPEKYTPYVKTSDWNATPQIACPDGKMRRWIYLKEKQNNPVLDWLSPDFSAYRLAAADALMHHFEKGQTFIQLDGKLPQAAQEMLALWIRKIGAFSVLRPQSTLAHLKCAPTDLAFDRITPLPYLHALRCRDATALRCIYRLLIEENIESKRLVHALEPFSFYPSDWSDFIDPRQKNIRYKEEISTAETLRQRIMKNDPIDAVWVDPNFSTVENWIDGCARALNIKQFELHKDELMRAHLLIAFAYALQPGVFSFSLSDLLGILPDAKEPKGPLETDRPTLYSSLPTQQKNPRSFFNQLKSILFARSQSNIAQGELFAVPEPANPSTLLLVHRLPKTRLIQLLALNFSAKPIEESFELPAIQQTSAIDLMSGLAEEKRFSSSRFSFSLPPFSGRAFYFQPKYY